jgi:hypothetical protein
VSKRAEKKEKRDPGYVTDRFQSSTRNKEALARRPENAQSAKEFKRELG